MFGKPISAYQLTQQKLAEMALEINRASLVALHIGRMKDAGTLRPEHVSLGKMGNVRGALEVCRSARTILGGNGITLEYPVIRHMNNLESVLTYEGTHEVHTLVVGARSPARRPSVRAASVGPASPAPRESLDCTGELPGGLADGCAVAAAAPTEAVGRRRDDGPPVPLTLVEMLGQPRQSRRPGLRQLPP